MVKYIEVSGQTLSYIEQNSTRSKTLVFIHSHSDAAGVWYNQLNAAALSDYRLLAFDLPGHGNSAHFEDLSQYNLPFIARLMVAAMVECLATDNYILAGMGLGTNVIAEMLALNIYPKGIAFISPTITSPGLGHNMYYKSAFGLWPIFEEHPSDLSMQHYMQNVLLSDKFYDRWLLINNYLRVRSPLRTHMYHSIALGNCGDEIKLVAENCAVPVLAITGEADALVKYNHLAASGIHLWQQKVHQIPGASHYVPLDKPDAVNKLLADYCAAFYDRNIEAPKVSSRHR